MTGHSGAAELLPSGAELLSTPERKCPLARAGGRDQLHIMQVEVERDEDGRWIAEVPALAGAMAYGATSKEAIARVEVLVLRALADRIEHGEEAPEVSRVFTVPA